MQVSLSSGRRLEHFGRLRALLIWLTAIAALLATPLSRAELLDEITVKRVGDTAEIEVRFSLPVQYLRHFPKDRGDVLRVNITLRPVNGVVPQVTKEHRKSPNNKWIPPFTVEFPDQGGRIKIWFVKPVKFKVGPGRDARSIRIRVPLPPKKSAPKKDVVGAPKAAVTTPVVVTPPVTVDAPAAVVTPPTSGVESFESTVPKVPSEIAPVPATGAQSPEASAGPQNAQDVRAGELMSRARAAIDSGDAPAAVDALNLLLNLPPNRFSKEAQELAGVARQQSGQISKARAEYELYLKLYPEGEGAVRVRNRLALLGEAPPKGERERDVVQVKERRATEKSLYGSFSQDYYHGSSKIDTTTKSLQLPGSQQLPGSETLSLTDQSALISAINLTARFRRDTSDTRFVVRDIYSANLLDDGTDENRLHAAYLEHEQKNLGLMFRGGRQSPPTGGLSERFDGAYLRKSLGSMVRVFGLGGTPVDYEIDSKRSFYQGGLEFGRSSDAWGLTLYDFNQTIDDIPDRHSVGGEARYFRDGSSFFSLLDYDVLFNSLNVLLTQANWQNANGTSVNVIFDRRKSPTLQTASALIGERFTSIRRLLDTGLTAEDLRTRASSITADSTLLLVGLTQTLNGHWQLGGDVSASRISATEGNGILPPGPSTGTIYTYTGQATATAIFGQGDINVLSVGLIDAPTYSGPLVLLSNSTNWNKWRFEPSLRYYEQTDDFGGKLTRTNPALRLSYRVRDSVSFEGEIGYEISNIDSTLISDKTQRNYFSIGYRWDLY